MVALLLEMGTEVSHVDAYGSTPLHTAVFCRYLECVELLCEHGADVDLRDHFGLSPMDSASKNDLEEILRILQASRATKEEKTGPTD